MILDLPGFDKITNRVTFGLIQCFHEEKNEIPSESACQVSYRKVLITRKASCSFLKWFLISGFLLYIVTGKIIEVKTENTEATATHQ